MIQIVSITEQGQITIPKFFREMINLSKKSKATVLSAGDALIIKPISDFFSLKGSIKPKNKPEDFHQMRKAFINHLGKKSVNR